MPLFGNSPTVELDADGERTILLIERSPLWCHVLLVGVSFWKIRNLTLRRKFLFNFLRGDLVLHFPRLSLKFHREGERCAAYVSLFIDYQTADMDLYAKHPATNHVMEQKTTFTLTLLLACTQNTRVPDE